MQLYADFPSFCGNVTYDWQPADYLDNPTSANPIARRSGVYTCTIGFIEDSSEVILDYLTMNSYPIRDSIVVTLGDKPEYSFSRAYGNSYMIDSIRYQTEDGICGVNLGLDCGYIISAYSEYRSDLSINEASSAGVLLLKTDDYGDIQWSRNYIDQGTYDLLGLTNQQKETIGFTTITHKIIPDFVLRSNLKDDEVKGNSDDGSEVLIRSGYFAAGESKVSNGKKEALFGKFDLEGELIASLNLKSTTHNLFCYELKNLADYSYLAVINRNISYSSSNSILLSKLDYEQEKLDTAKNILLNVNAGNSIYGRHYSIENILKSNSSTNVKIKNYEYEHIFAFGYMDSIQQDRIGVLILNDINNSNSTNIIKKQISVKDYSGKRSTENIKIIYDSSFVNKFYILNSQQLSEFDFDGNEIKTIRFNKYIEEIADAKYDRERNLIVFNNINFWPVKNFLLYEMNLTTNILKVKTHSDEYMISDNLNLIDNGFAIAARCFIDSPKSDIFFTHQKNDYNNCFADSIIPTQIMSFTVRDENVLTAAAPNGIIAYEPDIIELDHEVIDKGYSCVDLPEDYCDDCENIKQNSIELELFRVEDEGSQCCYELYIKNLSPCNLNGFSFELKYLLNDSLEIYHTELFTIPGNLKSRGRYKLKKICKLSENLPNELEVRIKHGSTYCEFYNEDTDEYENLLWTIDFECGENCCEALEVLSLVHNSENFCENILTYNLSTDCGSALSLQIWNSENEILYSSETTIETGSNKSINIDFDSSTLDNNEEIKIVLLNSLGEIICIKNHNYVDLMKCNCCDFDIEPEIYETYNYVRTVFDDTDFGLNCDVESMDVEYICGSLNITGNIEYTYNPLDQFDDVWKLPTPCFIGSVPCLNPTIRVTIYYNDSTTCVKTQSIPCLSSKKIFELDSYNLLNLNLYPNPTKKGSTLEFELTEDSEINIELYDFLGKKINAVYDGLASKGKKTFEINTSNLSKGIYILLIEVDENMVQQIVIVE